MPTIQRTSSKSLPLPRSAALALDLSRASGGTAAIRASIVSILLAATGVGCGVDESDTDPLTTTASASSTTGEASTSATSGQTSSGTTTGESGTAADDTPTTGVATTEAGNTDGATTGAETTGVAATEASTTGAATTEADTATETLETTGGGNDITGSCGAVCELVLECDPNRWPDQKSCVDGCVGFVQMTPGCEEAAIVFYDCIGDFTCAQLAASNQGEFGVCTDPYANFSAACR